MYNTDDHIINESNNTKTIFKFLGQSLKNMKSLVACHIVAIALFAYTAYGLLALIVGKISDSSISLSTGLIYIVALNIFIAIAVKMYRIAVWIILIPRLSNNIASKILGYTLAKPYQFFQANLSGDISRKRTDIIDNMPTIYLLIMDGFLLPLTIVISSMLSLQQLPFIYTIYISLWVASIILVFAYNSKKITTLSTTTAKNDSSLNGISTDIMSNMLSVKLFAREEHEQNLFDTLNNQNLSIKQVLEAIYDKVFTFYSFSFTLMLAITGWSLYTGVQNKIITTGQIIMFLQLSMGLVSRLWALALDMERYLTCMGKLRPAFSKLLSIEPTLNIETPININLTNPLGANIHFKNVFFGYDDNTLFNGLNVQIKAGEKVGLVGYSGAGKTTFVNLILNLFTIQKGIIEIDGTNVSKISKESLYRSITMIAQDCYLFNRSVFDNIAYGDLNASKEEVIQAAKMAQAHEFIVKLDNGYDSNVGDKGSKLSGGQRQRVMIARSILKKSKIIIMDEVTSQLDSANEHIIQHNLMKVMTGQTAIVIAHRLSTLKIMDRLLVFEQGKIIEDGNHEELLQRNGVYATLWKNQIGSH